MYKAAIFDLDGTLVNTLEDLANSGNYALISLSLPTHTPESYKSMLGHGVKELVRRMLPEDTRDEATQNMALALFSEYYAQHQLDSSKPYDGIPPLLAACKKQGLQLAVLSNKPDIYVQEIVAHSFGNIFDFVLGKIDRFPPKPAPDSLLYLRSQFNLPKEDVLYCGDSSVDMITAKNADITACGVTWGFRSREELLASGAVYVVDCPAELQNILLI